MEKKQLRQSITSMSDKWIKCQSKQRPGKYYMFNKETGETRWCSELEDGLLRTTGSKDTKNSTKTPTSIAKPKLKTPANDRLKRLQNTLKKDQKEKQDQKQVTTRRRKSLDQLPATRNGEGEKDKQKDNVQKKTSSISKSPNTSPEVKKDCQPSTSKCGLRIGNEMDKRSENRSPQTNKTAKKSNQKAPSKEAKKRSNCDLSTADSPKKRQKCTKQNPTFKEKEPPSTDVNTKDKPSTEQPKPEVGGIGSSFVSKIKAFCKDKFSSYYNAKKVATQKPLQPCLKKTNFKIPKKVPDVLPATTNLKFQKREPEKSVNELYNNNNCITTAPMTILMKRTATPNSGEGTVDFKAFSVTASPSHTPNNIIPVYQRGSANSRLQRLRNSLNQQKLTADPEISTSTRLCASACSSALACVIREAAIPNSSPNISQPDVDYEPMDWLPIEELKTEAIEISSSESNNGTQSIRAAEVENMGEYYGTVNKNLLRYAMEQKQGGLVMTEKWLNDYFYFILDTNVLIDYLVFLEELSHMKLCDTSGTILYVPYIVLQELDKLKQFAVSEGAKVRAVRAIKYLNAKFETKNKHLQAQSAMSELEHLVEITSPDDRIINCCLQVKQHVDNVILLTEDINLRNKAICNNILVSTKSDLIAKHT
ncbi:uncharacterized protein LOC101454433 isoform X2 [Ceratitis capitata]|uniref:uncharacterized protein LOC101454433 isoform X2 n=1 Tax=Ceratitis capitata TaxID=7213 RepID=UPI00061887AA|nr:uncharacterized protein LOC101454433 isoform X2 [Ceratitis capitata]